MLHILDGESSAGTLRQTNIAGEKLAFWDALIGGPAPADLSGDGWRKTRAQHLSESYGIDRAHCERNLRQHDGKLASFRDHEEVALWFEHDLFCQVNLLYLLDWFAARDLGKTRLSLICIGEFPGIENFRGLGQLSAEQLASLFGTRREVKSRQLELAASAWAAYCAPDPKAIEGVLRLDTSALPFLGAALRLHLARFPSVKNGLGRIENRGLELIHDGLNDFVRLFPKFSAAEPVYGLGDFQFYLALKELSIAREPLVVAQNGGNGAALGSRQISRTKFEITASGEAVREGLKDSVETNGIDLWLGGVHLSSQNLWRWDEQTQHLAH